jgi:hypothetical protein
MEHIFGSWVAGGSVIKTQLQKSNLENYWVEIDPI